jgi:hypothetical protein
VIRKEKEKCQTPHLQEQEPVLLYQLACLAWAMSDVRKKIKRCRRCPCAQLDIRTLPLLLLPRVLRRPPAPRKTAESTNRLQVCLSISTLRGTKASREKVDAISCLYGESRREKKPKP